MKNITRPYTEFQTDKIYSGGVVQTARTPWSPPDVDSLKLWYDATDDSTITESSGAVSAWADKSGNSHDLTQGVGSRQPTTGSRTINSLNVIDFDGGDVMANTYGSTLSQPVTGFIVGAFDVTGGQYFFDGIVSGNRFALFSSAGSVLSLFAGGSQFGTSTIDINNHIYGYTINGASSEILIDSTVVDTGNPGAGTMTGVTIGARYDNSSYLDGGIGEFIMYEKVLNTTEVTFVEQYLSDKWGISI